MTTPVERMRALRWGEELLESILADHLVPAELRQSVATLIDRYPDQSQLFALMAEPNSQLPQGFRIAIFDAGLLFEDLAKPQYSAVANRHLLQYTMRHYPSRDNGWFRPEDFEYFRVGELLATDDEAIGPTSPSLLPSGPPGAAYGLRPG